MINVFWLSSRWRTFDEVDAVRLAALAREARSCRRFESRAGAGDGEAAEAYAAHVGRRATVPRCR